MSAVQGYTPLAGRSGFSDKLILSEAKKSQVILFKAAKSFIVVIGSIATILTGHLGLDLSKKMIGMINKSRDQFFFKHLDRKSIDFIKDKITKAESVKDLMSLINEINPVKYSGYPTLRYIESNKEIEDCFRKSFKNNLIKEISYCTQLIQLYRLKELQRLFGFGENREINSAIREKERDLLKLTPFQEAWRREVSFQNIYNSIDPRDLRSPFNGM